MDGPDSDASDTGDEHREPPPTAPPGAGANGAGGGRSDKPISFDFKLRLGSRESTTALTARASGELVQSDQIDWESFTGLREDDEPREYKTEGNLPSLIVELANKMVTPDPFGRRLVDAELEAAEAEAARAARADGPAVDEPTGPPPFTEPPVPEIVVATVEDDPMLSAVVDQILDEPPVATPPAAPAPAAAPAATASPAAASPVAPAVRAPVAAAPDGPIELPRIVAATPDLPSGEMVQPHTPAPSGEVPSSPVAPNPTPTSGPVQMFTGVEAMAMATTAPPPPVVEPPAIAPLQLARIERKPGAERPTKPVDFHALLGQAGIQPQVQRRRTKRHPFRALFRLVVVLAIIAGGLYAGKKYILDARWDSALEPAADAVADARGLGWDHSISVTVLSLPDYGDRLTASVLGADADEDDLAAEWRAMGLLEGDLDLDTVGQLAAAFRPVFYDPVDGNLFELEDTPREMRELYLHQALAMALLDQRFGWSDDLSTLGAAERSGRLALVDGDASATALEALDPNSSELNEINEDGAELVDEVKAELGDVAGLTDYPTDLLVGPRTETIGLFDDRVVDLDQRNAVLDASVASDAAALDGRRGLSSQPAAVGDAARQAGMVYWYYVLAGRMSDADAWNAAVAWNGDEVEFDPGPDGDCVNATMAATDEPARAVLLGALQRWAAGAPAGSASTVTETAGGEIEVRSCDPGPAADTKKDDGILFWGFSDVEYGIVRDFELTADAAARACTINALRNFGVLGQAESGDVDGARSTTDAVIATCAEAGTEPAAAPPAPAEETPASQVVSSIP